ncbi:MAG: MFS transporter [Alphaproteobacteria bacterium]
MNRARAWIVWAPSALFFGYAFFLRVSPSVMAGDLMREFAVGGALLGNLAAFYFYAYASIQIPVGVLVDNFGPRRIITAAALVTAIGSLAFATAESLEAAYAGRLLIGIGAGFSWVAGLSVVARWFPPRRFAFVSAASNLVGMLGAAAAQAPLAAIVDTAGWRPPMMGAALFGIALSVAAWLLVRDRPRPADGAASAPARKAFLHGLKLAASNGQTWLIAIYCGAVIAPFLGLSSLWGVPYLMHAHGFERPRAALFMSAMIAGMAAGGLLFGWISDRIGRRKPLMFVAIIGQAASILVTFYWQPVTAGWMFLPIGAIGFFASGLIIGFATARDANSPESTGAATGMVNMAVIGGGALIQPLIGLMLDSHWDGGTAGGTRVYSMDTYETAFLTLFGSLAVAFLAALLVRETWCGEAPRSIATR